MSEDLTEDLKNLPIKLRPKNLAGTITFTTYDELAEWANSEREFWEKLTGKTPDIANWSNFIGNQLRDQYQNLNSWAVQARDGDENAKNNLESILESISTGGVPVSEDSTGRLVAFHLEKDPYRAAAHAMLAGDGNFDIPQPGTKAISAMISAILDGLVDQSGVNAREESLTKLRQRWDSRYRTTEQKLQVLLDTASDDYRKGRSVARRAVRKAVTQMVGHRDRMAEIEDTFTTKIAVQASETYWGSRRDEHTSKVSDYESIFKWFAGVGLLVTVISLILIARAVPDTIDPSKFGTFQIVLFGLLPLLFIWILRLIVARWRRHNGLKEDAEQRLAMLSTFLSLSADGNASDEERILMLSALFRPSGEDVEDEVPHPIVEAVMKRLPR